ncbi:hypothetical protein AV650_29035 (plasmid) [Serratia fonticola]|nr:hypothetical protein AV650_29035 [Serratia fonticola]
MLWIHFSFSKRSSPGKRQIVSSLDSFRQFSEIKERPLSVAVLDDGVVTGMDVVPECRTKGRYQRHSLPGVNVGGT